MVGNWGSDVWNWPGFLVNFQFVGDFECSFCKSKWVRPVSKRMKGDKTLQENLRHWRIQKPVWWVWESSRSLIAFFLERELFQFDQIENLLRRSPKCVIMFQEREVVGSNPVGCIETCGHSFSVANSAWKLLVWWIGEHWSLFCDGWEQCWTQTSVSYLSLSSRKRKSSSIFLKIFKYQLVTGIPPHPLHPPTLGHLIGSVWRCAQALSPGHWELPSSGTCDYRNHLWSVAWLWVQFPTGWCPWWLKEDPEKLQRWS